MKKKVFLFLQVCVILCAVCLSSCNDVIENNDDRASKGTSIIPNPMTVGQKVTISGPNFREASEVVFPGGVSVSNLTRSGDFQLSMTVPSGAAIIGNITVKLPGGDFTIPTEVIIVTPKTNIAIPDSREINEENGLFWVGPNDKLEIRGEGLGAVAALVLPGDITIEAMNFRKTESLIEVYIPMGVARLVAKVQLIMHDGSIQYTSNEVDFSGDGYIPPELLPFCGRSFKVWSWDEEEEFPFGNGGYGSGTGPAWWKPDVDVQFGVHGRGAKMSFQLPNKMTLTLKDGTVYEGKFKVDLTKPVGTWSKGKLEVTSGDEQLSIIGGTYGNYNGSYSLYPKIFDIITLTNAEMMLAFQYPEETGTANFYMFRVREDEGEGSGGGAIRVPDEYKPFVGGGSKIWEWNDADGNCYGKGDGLNEDNPTWWAAPEGGKKFEAEEGMKATMTLTYAGKGNLKLTKNKEDGSSESGSWDMDMSARKDGWKRAIGKFTTDKITVLSGKDDGGKDVFEYWILKMSDTEMMLGKSEEGDDWDFEKEGWGTASLWLFRAQEE